MRIYTYVENADKGKGCKCKQAKRNNGPTTDGFEDSKIRTASVAQMASTYDPIRPDTFSHTIWPLYTLKIGKTSLVSRFPFFYTFIVIAIVSLYLYHILNAPIHLALFKNHMFYYSRLFPPNYTFSQLSRMHAFISPAEVCTV